MFEMMIVVPPPFRKKNLSEIWPLGDVRSNNIWTVYICIYYNFSITKILQYLLLYSYQLQLKKSLGFYIKKTCAIEITNNEFVLSVCLSSIPLDQLNVTRPIDLS